MFDFCRKVQYSVLEKFKNGILYLVSSFVINIMRMYFAGTSCAIGIFTIWSCLWDGWVFRWVFPILVILFPVLELFCHTKKDIFGNCFHTNSASQRIWTNETTTLIRKKDTGYSELQIRSRASALASLVGKWRTLCQICRGKQAEKDCGDEVGEQSEKFDELQVVKLSVKLKINNDFWFP